jgi:SAM-dependent methyltransferase
MPSVRLPLVAGRCAFGDDPVGYGQARPEYPRALYDQLARICPVGVPWIFEVGPGTGQATRWLLARTPRLVAIEPDPRLADYLTAELCPSPQIEIVRTSFEEVCFQPGSFDLGVAATSFHWIEQASGLDKVVSLLRPGGWWAMWWNVFGDPDDPDEFQKASDLLFHELPGSRSWMDGRRPFALNIDVRLGEMRSAGLMDTEHHLMHWTLKMDTAHVVALACSFSQVSQADPQQRSRFLDKLADLAERQFAGRVERRFMTSLYVGRKP